MPRKIYAFITSAFWTILPCFLAGSVVGLFFPKIFWACVGYIVAFSAFFMLFDRVPVRLYAGSLKRLKLLPLLKYGYTSTDNWPSLTMSDLLGPGWLYRRYYRFKR